ncbi:MAG: hypothetical protein IT301_03455 [Dehalococcoidia bacterium]|nr:hypothetical protein [Dehalococcoidia bacterium]
MEVQTLTFCTRGMTERQAFHYVESLRLGISEFDGLVRYARTRRAVAGHWAVFFAWKDKSSVAAFRHSELYARLALSPNVTRFQDHVESFVEAAPEALLSAA